jgi:excisionase family DNA binding protein
MGKKEDIVHAAYKFEASFSSDDIITPVELASRLKVSKTWVYEMTRQRAKVRHERPLPCIRLGKFVRFSWVQVCEWMARNCD